MEHGIEELWDNHKSYNIKKEERSKINKTLHYIELKEEQTKFKIRKQK